MKANKIAVLLSTALLLSSCGIYKNYERPTEITTEGIYGDQQNGTSAGIAELKWREIFTDPLLQKLIDKALTQNTSMRQADLRIQEAQNSLKESRLAFFPSLSFAPNGAVSGLIDPYNREQYKGIMGNGATKTYGFPLALNWQIDCFGQLRNSKKKAQVSLENMKTVRQAVQTSLIANIASLYYTLAMLDCQKQITTETAAHWKESLEMTRHLMDAGETNRAAVANSEANYWSILTSLEEIDHSIREVENAISNILGETPHKIERNSLASFTMPAVCTTGMPISLLSHRPDVKQAELDLASAFYNKNIAKAAFYPNLTLSATGSFANSISGAGIVNPGGFILNAIAQLAQPIFQNGKIRAAYKNSKAEMEVATIGFQQTLLDAGKEVNTSMAAIRSANAKKELIAKQVKSLESAVEATELLFKTTPTNYLQVLTAQTGLLQAQMNEVANNYDIIANTITLYQALGGGSELEE